MAKKETQETPEAKAAAEKAAAEAAVAAQAVVEAAAEDSNLIWVVAKVDGQVALWERNEQHPNGEVYVSSATVPVQVYGTPAVTARILNGTLVKAPTPVPSSE